jgi:outer membrane protein OmpA-like peptidoglycan-associated protein
MMTALFANNSSILSKVQITAIKTLSKALLLKDIKTITIVGFTNAAPSVGNNKLAIARAKTLARYLKLNGVKQSITIKSVVTAKAKANQSASALIALRKAEIWIVLK